MNNLISLDKHEEFLDNIKQTLDEDTKKYYSLKEEKDKM